MRKSNCTICKVNERRNHTSYYCKKCHNEYQKAYYKKNPASISKSAKRQTKVVREYIIKVKNKPCFDCGKNYPYYVMDFDHVSGQKKFNLSEAASKWTSLKKVEEEILKCELVCANCHRERTFNRLSRGVIGRTIDFGSIDLGSIPDEIT